MACQGNQRIINLQYPSNTSKKHKQEEVLAVKEDLETFSLLWLDAYVNTADNREVQQKLRTVINCIKTFDSVGPCQEYLERQDENEKILLIVSGSYGRQIVSKIHNLKQVTAIYVYCMNIISHLKWTRQFNKVMMITTSSTELIEKLSLDQRQRDKIEDLTMIPISISHQRKSTSNFNGDFMWSQLFLEVLLRVKQTPDDRQVLIQFCKEIYVDNDIQTKIIDEFERTYCPEKALWWYTRNTFLFKMLNNALRTNNIETLFLFRFFIEDLYNQLKNLHQNQCHQSQLTKVYRVQLLSVEEINMVQSSIGNYFSINKFLLTSTNGNLSSSLSSFITNCDNNTLQPVIFEINIDQSSNIECKPFANISKLSYFKDENEILFSIGTIFQIENVQCNEQDIWIINLNLCDENNDSKLKILLNQIRQESDLVSFVEDFSGGVGVRVEADLGGVGV
ncbi:unnamed protein product [Didymodactylos carnosus]|uniref:NAD(P)(+)--arginine ADP-ribosyltransferase n=1 Tax=Didymodactylos carnosus TaxID=1234261 RepID=A0A8S2HLB4_9BILA|nr:unnamed protein product [Didymodactylos carnosus]CAF3660023.1 unnamed protein product [Didymodactylos carnosus]